MGDTTGVIPIVLWYNIGALHSFITISLMSCNDVMYCSRNSNSWKGAILSGKKYAYVRVQNVHMQRGKCYIVLCILLATTS